MKNANKSKGQKLLAMAIVAMFAMCAFAVCVPSDSDAGVYGGVSDNTGTKTNQIYAVSMSVGQTFTYDNINTNLDAVDGTVEITGAPAVDGNTATGNPNLGNGTSGKKFTINFTTEGTYTYIITATWTHNTDKTLTQTATQTFNFTVSKKIELPTSYTGYGIEGVAQNNIEIPYKGPATGMEIKYSAFAGDGETLVDGSKLFTASISNNKLIVTPATSVKDTDAKYGVTITVRNPNSTDSDSVNIKYQVFDTVTISAPAADYTYEGDKNAPATITFTTNWDSVTGAQNVSYALTTSMDNGAKKNVLVAKDSTGKVVTVEGVSDATIETVVKEDAKKAVFTATLTTTGTVTPASGTDGSQDVSKKSSTASTTLTVYKALAFASAPTIGDSAVTTVTAAGNNISLSSYITGAYKVVYDWGDGSQTSAMDCGGKTATTYSAYHAYARAGTYTVTIYATNDQGTTTAQVFHSTNGVEIPETPAEPEEKSFFEEHGIQFLIFAILVIILAIAFFYFGIQSPFVVILMIVFAALSVLCFVYNDIGGIIDAVKGFKL